jgi:hypothetical protein
MKEAILFLSIITSTHINRQNAVDKISKEQNKVDFIAKLKKFTKLCSTYSVLTLMSDNQRSTFIDNKANDEADHSSKEKNKIEEIQFNDNQSVSTSSCTNINSVTVRNRQKDHQRF